ncbi:uncharacterized protein C2845_PM03G25580 [Panicum miliaceum]|uniref:Uncharacterized protein n=1 Tax=Panicum miliaceum TaxID=4540 RepID=A0A3L6TA33_PANMI|nr:uncharacterized protein C2845_PM03G25580 [Panicum miliaceum]
MWAQHAFNEKVAELRRVAVDAFVRVKGRWACLQKRTEVKLQDLPGVLGACCVLQNICESRREEMDPALRCELTDDETVPQNPVRSDSANNASFETPSAIRQRGIAPFYKGFDVIQQAHSRIEKTATFRSGILQQLDYGLVECQALVLSPTHELAQQIERVMCIEDFVKFDSDSTGSNKSKKAPSSGMIISDLLDLKFTCLPENKETPASSITTEQSSFVDTLNFSAADLDSFSVERKEEMTAAASPPQTNYLATDAAGEKNNLISATTFVSWVCHMEKECLAESVAWDTLAWFAALIAISGYLYKYLLISWFSETVVKRLPTVLNIEHGGYSPLQYSMVLNFDATTHYIRSEAT